MKPAVFWRGNLYIGYPRHQEAINAAFKGMPKSAIFRAYCRVMDGKEDIIFGWINDVGEFETDEYQQARKTMYGFS